MGEGTGQSSVRRARMGPWEVNRNSLRGRSSGRGLSLPTGEKVVIQVVSRFLCRRRRTRNQSGRPDREERKGDGGEFTGDVTTGGRGNVGQGSILYLSCLLPRRLSLFLFGDLVRHLLESFPGGRRHGFSAVDW